MLQPQELNSTDTTSAAAANVLEQAGPQNPSPVTEREVVKCGNNGCPLFEKNQFMTTNGLCRRCRVKLPSNEPKPEKPVAIITQRAPLKEQTNQGPEKDSKLSPAEEQANALVAQRVRATLNSKELWVIILVAASKKNKEIAVALGTTEITVKNLLRTIYDKVGVSDRHELVAFMLYHPTLLQPEDFVQITENTAAAETAQPVPAATDKNPEQEKTRKIINGLCKLQGVSVEEIQSDSRTHGLVDTRALLAYLLRTVALLEFNQIGQLLKRSETMAKIFVGRINTWVRNDVQFSKWVADLTAQILS